MRLTWQLHRGILWPIRLQHCPPTLLQLNVGALTQETREQHGLRSGVLH